MRQGGSHVHPSSTGALGTHEPFGCAPVSGASARERAARQHRFLRRALGGGLTTAGLLLSACASEARDSAGGWQGHREALPGGGSLVTNAGQGVWAGARPWAVHEELRIGATDGDGPDVFGSITAIETDADANLYVFDDQARELRIFDVDGALLRRSGRQGGGPGEFEHVVGMSLAPDGALWIVDPVNARYTVVAQDGGQRSLRRSDGLFRLPWFGGFTESGTFRDAILLTADRRVDDAMVHVDSGGVATDTVPLPNPVLVVPRRGRMSFPLPFAPAVLRALDRRGFAWTAVSSEYRLVQTSLTGDTVMIVTREMAPAPLSGMQQDSIRRYTQELATQLGVQVPDAALPTAAPMLQWFTADDQGHLWVCRASTAPCTTLDVFDEEGRFMGEVALPFAVQGDVRPIIRGSTLVAVTEDSLGVQRLVRARIGGRR